MALTRGGIFSADQRRRLWRGTGVVWLVFAVVFLPVGIYIFPIALLVGVLALLLLVRAPQRRLSYAAAMVAVGIGVLMVALIPSTTGSEYAFAAEAVMAFSTAAYTVAASRLYPLGTTRDIHQR